MLPSSILLLLGISLGPVTATPTQNARLTLHQRQDASAVKQKVLIGGGSSNTALLAEWDGTKFNVLNNLTLPGVITSWLAFKEPNIVYTVNEGGKEVHMLTLDSTVTTLSDMKKTFNSSSGVVHLEFNKDKTRMVGSAFGEGTIDVFNVAQDGQLTLHKKLVSDDKVGPKSDFQKTAHPHQAVLDNSGRYFFVNDLGTDTILILDSANNFDSIAGRVKVQPGCGPRHGFFYPPNPANATHYVVVCELLNAMIVHQTNYSTEPPTLVPTQLVSTFGEQFPPRPNSDPHAGEVAVSSDGKSVYVSNRLTFPLGSPADQTDNIAHLSVKYNATAAPPSLILSFVNSINSQGQVPRMFSLSGDQKQAFLFSTNQNSGTGLVGFKRCENSGELSLIESSEIDYSAFAGVNGDKPQFGPQFVMPIPVASAAAV